VTRTLGLPPATSLTLAAMLPHVFHMGTLNKLLTPETTFGSSLSTDGIQLQLSVVGKDVAAARVRYIFTN
jgi:hypothetical protein